jgi:cytochrome c oxidase assembly factor CtaG
VAIGVLIPPLDVVADRSFAWHMLQHVLLVFVAVPLLLLGAYDAPWQRWLSRDATIGLAKAAHGVVARVVLAPPTGWFALVAFLWIAHFSPLYAAALEHPAVHLFEHAAFVVTATLFWLPVIGNAAIPAMAYPARLLYLFLALPQGAFLGAALLSERFALYAPYVAQLGASGALADQRNAAAVMWIGGGCALFVALMIVAGGWAMRERAEAILT